MGIPTGSGKMNLHGYLNSAGAQNERLEYFHGKVFALAGGTDTHNDVCFNMRTVLQAALKGTGCRVYKANVRLQVEKNAHYCYPDVFVTCSNDDHSNAQLKKQPVLPRKAD